MEFFVSIAVPESYSTTYLFTQQVQTIRVTEVFFGVKHLQEEDKYKTEVTYVYRCCTSCCIPSQGCCIILVSYCQRGVNQPPSLGRDERQMGTKGPNVNRGEGSKVKWWDHGMSFGQFGALDFKHICTIYTEKHRVTMHLLLLSISHCFTGEG